MRRLFANLFGGDREPDYEAILSRPAVGCEKIPEENGFYKVNCPYCLRSYEAWELEFRAVVDKGMTSSGTKGGGMAGKETERNRTNFLKDTDSSPFGGKKTQQIQAPLAEQHQKDDADEKSSNYFPMEKDARLAKFSKEFGLDEDHKIYGKVLSMTNNNGDISRVEFHGNPNVMLFEKAKTYMEETRAPVKRVWDKFGHMTEERICPHCHNKIADRAGNLPSYVIVFFGNTSCGKTVYKIRLLHEIYSKHALLPGNPVMGGKYYMEKGLDGLGTTSIEELYQRSFGNATANPGTAIVEGTEVKYIYPITMTLQRNGRELALLTLFDFPGEAIWGGEDKAGFVSLMQDRLREVDGIIFLLDPTYLPVLQKNLPKEYRDSSKEANIDRTDWAMLEKLNQKKASPSTVLQEGFVKNYLSGGGILDVPMAIVYSKADLFRKLLDLYHTGKIRDTEVEEMTDGLSEPPLFLSNWVNRRVAGRTRRDHTSVDMGNILEAGRELERFVGDDVLEDLLRNNFKRSQLFAMSAVGAPVEFTKSEGGEDKHNVPEAAALRVTEPLEYLLWMFGLVENAPMGHGNAVEAARLKNPNAVGGN